MEELRARVDAYGPKSVAEALEEVESRCPPARRSRRAATPPKNDASRRRAEIRSLRALRRFAPVDNTFTSSWTLRPDPPDRRRSEPEAVLHLLGRRRYEYVFPDSELGNEERHPRHGRVAVIGRAVRVAFDGTIEAGPGAYLAHLRETF